MTASATREFRGACIMSGMGGCIATHIRVPGLVAELEARRRPPVAGVPGA